MAPQWLVALTLVLNQVISPASYPSSHPPQLEAAAASALIPGVTTVVASDVAPANNSKWHTVSCPAGMVALSGGVDLANIKTMHVSTSAPYFSEGWLYFQPDGHLSAPIGWKVAVVNTETSDQSFKVAVNCAPLSGVVTAVTSTTISKNSFGDAKVRCPDGTVALGGGIDTANHLYTAISSTAPIHHIDNRLFDMPVGEHPAPLGWQASAINKSVNFDYLTKIAAVCAPVAGVTTVVTSRPIGANSFITGSAACPAHTFAVGGGLDPEDISTMQVSSSAPTFGSGVRLFLQAPGTYGDSPGWQTSLINTSAEVGSFNTAAICGRSAYLTFVPYVIR